MTDRHSDVFVDVLLMLVFLALGVWIWGSLLKGLKDFLPVRDPYLWSGGFMLVINAGHFFFGLFRTDESFSDIHGRGMMTSYPDYIRIVTRIIALVTISPSVYMRLAIIALRAKDRSMHLR